MKLVARAAPRRLSKLIRRRRRPLILCVVIAVYALVLAAWTRGPSLHQSAVAGLSPSTSSTATDRSGAVVSTASGASTARASSAGSRSGSVGLPVLPVLPQSTDARDGGFPQHSIVLTATSDAVLLRIGYRIARGHPSEHVASNIASPLRVVTVGHGYGLMAAFGVQASPNATYVTCTIAIDGVVRSTRTLHGPWTFAVCVA